MTNRVIAWTGLGIAVAATAMAAGLSASPALCAEGVAEGIAEGVAEGVAEDAAEGVAEGVAEGAAEDEQQPPGLVDKGHAGASDRVRRLGAWADRFFADENYEAEANESQLRLRIQSFSQLYDGTEVEPTARLRLKLPALNDRLRLDFASPGEEEDLEAAGDGDVGPPPPGAEEEQASAALSYFVRAVKDRTIIARLGLKFDGYKPNPFAGVRYRELLPMSDVWNFRFTQRFRYYAVERLESRTGFDFERVLEEDALFRTSVNGTWLEEDPDYFYSVGFAVFEPIDEKSAAEVQLVNSFRTDPHRLDQITVRIRHRQKIWRDWLVFDVAPQVAFPRERDYDAVPGIMFSLEATFGG